MDHGFVCLMMLTPVGFTGQIYVVAQARIQQSLL